MNTTDTCRTCKWFESADHTDHGRCKRYPPPYPHVAADDWCGEHKRTPQKDG